MHRSKRLIAALLAAAVAAAAYLAAVPAGAASGEWTGTIVASVSFRTGPGTDYSRIRYLKKGETVRILHQYNAYWYKAEDANGKIGYVSTSSKYISVKKPDPPANAAPAAKGKIVASVSLRKGPGTSYDRIRYAQKGETVEILDKVNAYWYHVRDQYGNIGYLSTSSKYIEADFPAAPSPSPSPSPSPAPAPSPEKNENKGVILASVSFRKGPGTSYDRIRYLSKGETVDILGMYNEYWYRVRDKNGTVGYVSSGAQYISANYKPPVFAPEEAALLAQRVIEAGLRYLGTPYEYGSDRNTTTTFDCSDFVRTAFLEGAGIFLPSNSRTQADYVRQIGRVSTDLTKLKPGDILFFMSYKGPNASDYAGVNKSAETVSHNAIYLGDGKILHTYSKESGGVRIDKMEGQWLYRFLFGGSAM